MCKRSKLVLLAAISLVGCHSQAVFQRAPESADSDVVIKNASSAGDIFAMPASKLVVKLEEESAGDAKPAPEKKPPADKKPAPAGKPAAGASDTPKTGTTSFRVASDQYSVAIIPVESSRRYLVRPVESFFSSTSVSITKIPNTDLPSAVAVQFTDNVKTRISQIGGLVTSFIGSVLPLLAATNEECKKPPRLESFTLTIDKESDFAAIPGQTCWKYSIKFETPNPAVGAISWARFEQELGNRVNYFPVPSCRDAAVSLLREGDRQPIVIATKIADPNYVRLAPLPLKGQITMHPICGADISETSGDRFGSFIDDVSEVFKQAKQIDEALKASAKGSKK